MYESLNINSLNPVDQLIRNFENTHGQIKHSQENQIFTNLSGHPEGFYRSADPSKDVPFGSLVRSPLSKIYKNLNNKIQK